ncbi:MULTISPECIES: N-acetyltransferase [unclassified Ruegeria]|uniref:GNAT family N-acetyltransferase n=1 Tax=unclassified Ruegeria TaxID=2625375 RepID=UPI001487A971|nr:MULTISPECIES: N-acetyltransferase [unclassified Ruegeria]NOE36345.1 GNAT family N-acetyltransferase [Ruegeria sp. HKCCD7318]
MTQVAISPVTLDKINDLDFALRALSAEMNDRHVANVDVLKAAFADDHPAFNALLAYNKAEVVGAIVWTPVFSTTRGGGGLFVSDLWVSSSARGRGIGNKLLSRSVFDADKSSGACFLKLAVHRTNPSALAYYTHIGFREETDMRTMILEGAPLRSLKNF